MVDDEESFLLSFQAQLNHSYKVITANGGEQALIILKSNTPDLIILDLIMPNVNGFMLLETISQDEKTNRIPVVIYSSKELDITEKEFLTNSNATFFNKGETSVAEIASYLEKYGNSLR